MSLYTEEQIAELAPKIWAEKGPFGNTAIGDMLASRASYMTRKDAFEDKIFITFAESEGEHFFIYAVCEINGGSIVFRSLRILKQKYPDRDSMHASMSHLHAGASNGEKESPLADMKVTRKGEMEIWECGDDLKVISQPPVWNFIGTFKDPRDGRVASLDLLHTQEIHEFNLFNPGMSAGSAGSLRETWCRTEGELVLDGKTYKIKDGKTIYERALFTACGWQDMGARYWILGDCGPVKYLSLTTEGGGSDAFVYYDDGIKPRVTNFEDVEKESVAWFDDPVTGDTVPYKWRFTYRSRTKGTLILNITAFDRLLTFFAGEENTIGVRGGLTAYDNTCKVDATFIKPDGSKIEAKDGCGIVEYYYMTDPDKRKVSL